MGRIIFYEGIVEPPTETLAIRGLCLYLNVFGRKSEILLETQKENRDLYFKWIKQTGLSDFVEEIVFPEYKVRGFRVANEIVRPPYLRVDRISFDNLNDVLSRLKSV
jgi:hypothetical protein|tara:strand:+ start:970 stop:1290 length:321 start_codon:yes stop_codon:yes gene_type:complete